MLTKDYEVHSQFFLNLIPPLSKFAQKVSACTAIVAKRQYSKRFSTLKSQKNICFFGRNLIVKVESAFYKNSYCKGFFRTIMQILFYPEKKCVKTMLRQNNGKGFQS